MGIDLLIQEEGKPEPDYAERLGSPAAFFTMCDAMSFVLEALTEPLEEDEADLEEGAEEMLASLERFGRIAGPGHEDEMAARQAFSGYCNAMIVMAETVAHRAAQEADPETRHELEMAAEGLRAEVENFHPMVTAVMGRLLFTDDPVPAESCGLAAEMLDFFMATIAMAKDQFSGEGQEQAVLELAAAEETMGTLATVCREVATRGGTLITDY